MNGAIFGSNQHYQIHSYYVVPVIVGFVVKDQTFLYINMYMLCKLIK